MRQVVAAMGDMEERLMAAVQALTVKVDKVDALGQQLTQIDSKLEKQGARLDAVQSKVDLSMASLGQVQCEQALMTKALKAAATPSSPLLPTPRPTLSQDAASTSTQPPPEVEVPVRSGQPPVRDNSDVQGRRSWVPKMDFPKFDGTDVCVWVDNCETYFALYQITEGFKVSAASLNMIGDAAHWYQAWKQERGWPTWEQLREAVLNEFEINIKRAKMEELLLLTQTGTVSEYRSKFLQLVYHIRLYDPATSGLFLVSRFVMGLKDELRCFVAAQEPETVHQAARVALAFEGAFCNRKVAFKKDVGNVKFGDKGKVPVGDLWKAQHFKEYRRTHGLCFKCGEKYSPAHTCGKTEGAQLKTMEVSSSDDVLTDEILDVVTAFEQLPDDNMLLSLQAVAGTSATHSLQLRALAGNQVVIILVDSGSSHSFINADLCSKLNLSTDPIPVSTVKVANGETLQCEAQVSEFSWWIQGCTFVSSLKVLSMGGHDIVLGMDWLSKFSPMTCNWADRWLEFTYQGKLVKLQGIQSHQLQYLSEVSSDQMMKWQVGNDIWALAVVDCLSSPLCDSAVPASIQDVLQKYSSVFQPSAGLPPHRELDHSIPLVPGAIPVNSRPYRYSPAQKDEIEKQVQEMLESGLISRSCSPFASPVLLVKKKDNTWRFCVDYRRLNAITIKNKFPLPIVDELLDELAGTRFFSKLDLRSGYHQIRMKETDEEKTAFKTHHGHFQFRVMPFGLTNAPATFQCLMNSIFEPYLRKFVLVFMDDILVYSPSLETHAIHLDTVLQVLQQHQLSAKLSKCSFAASQLEYLGHIISADGVATDPEKTRIMRDWPVPTNVTELRGFLGLTGYYRKFVKNYGVIAKPLTVLLQKNAKFIWTDSANSAFLQLKHAMCSTPVLALPDFTKTFVLETDACATGIGAVLSQEGHPIAFYSKALGMANQKLSIYEKEFLAIMMAIDKWRSYLLRGPFTIKTDHQSLCHLDDQILGSELQRKAMTKLIGLQYKFQYKRGVDNKSADALSRVGHLFATVSGPYPKWIQEVVNSYATDADAQQLLTELAVSSPNDKGFMLSGGLIKKHDKIWVGANSGLQSKLIAVFHSSPIGGHSGIHATYHRLKKLFVWTGMKQAVEEFVQQCGVCQQAKHEHCKYPGLLQPLPIPEGSWQDISMDFIEGLPLSKGANTILVVVDRFTKYAHFLSLKHPFSASQVAELFLDRVAQLYGMPKSIVSDRDRVFTSSFWKTLFARFGIPLNMSTAYHPQSDGQTERVNQCLEMYLRCAVANTPSKWASWLPLAQFWYNTSFHTSLKCSPHKALYGSDPSYGLLPSLSVEASDESSSSKDATALLKARSFYSSTLQHHLARAQNHMKQVADSKRTLRVFQVGDSVFLKLQPYAQTSVVNRPCHKLAMKYFGPFPILERVGSVAYKLQLPPASQVHSVFHVSQLKPSVPSHVPVYTSLPDVVALDVEDLIPTEILDCRMVKKGNAAIVQVRVRWGSLPDNMATWEDYDVIRTRFPAVSALGQAGSPAGGTVISEDIQT